MPGPMLGVTIDGSLKKGGWRAGPKVVLGHGILELILICIMTFGLKDFFSDPRVAGFIGIFGGIFLAWMGYGMIRSGLGRSVSLKGQKADAGAGLRSLVLTGALVSITNPYFILWWSTTGIELIRRSYTFGLAGILIFFMGHILSDFVWYTTISIAFSGGKKLIGDDVYGRIIIVLGAFIIFFSAYFVYSGWKLLHGILF